ncbi:cutinase family protein [Nocardia sp. SYP-A9097]|uniref:cutinase family protein n=1 Tax=Nocardia sp. SYP-A9097 TaxID=2663237 RepID=UPI00129AE2C5|nr:cutinase family protein [Nocardia sp. SYP-A9097]MRH92727.1 cutinase family protein [Nocardia sp. SYP-A9097]
MADRKVLLSEKWRIAWGFAAMLMVVSIFFPLPKAHADWCSDVDVVVARGTGEPGWLGDVVGNQLYGMLQDRLPVSITAYPVAYPADYSFDVGAGTADLVGHLAAQAAACPAQRFIVVGYSQGAAVVHAALGTGAVTWYPGRVQLPGDLGSRIAAVLLFGDPMRAIGWNVPDWYVGRTGDWCTGGDPVCGAGMNAPSHVSYSDSLVAAANFAAVRI